MASKGSKGQSSGADTPAMRQYRGFKEAHPGCVLFFRMGDFYEMFFDDAELAHRVLGVTLTRRTEGVPMAGVPYHSVEGYLRRMIQAGHRVAVCEQVEEASQAKGVVKRDVTRVITPGTLTDETLLADEQVNPCAAVVFHGSDSGGGSGGGGRASLAWAELSTGSFAVATVEVDGLADELARVGPGELLYCETADGEVPPRVAELPTGAAKTGRPGWQFRPAEASEALKKQYRVASLAGFGLADDDPAVGAAGGLLAYLLETQKRDEPSGGDGVLPHLRPPRAVAQTQHLVIDRASLASLEVESTLRGGDEGSLLGVFRRGGCVTAMGKRLLREWLCYPLAERGPIEARQRVVRALVDDRRFAEELAEALDALHDVPRITARLAVDRATPRDVVGLGRSAAAAEKLAEVLADRPPTSAWAERLDAVRGELDDMAQRIAAACKDEDVPAHLRDGGLIRDGFDAELDEQRTLKRDANRWLAGYQKKLIDRTGVASLKVGFNKVFGYYIEVTAANRVKMEDFLSDPDPEAGGGWARKQTLKNAERFITPELKEFEGNVLRAGERAVAREQSLFAELCGSCREQIAALHGYADVAAELDVLLCFGRRAARYRYVCPELVDTPTLDFAGARHPVLDELLGDGLVPNDVVLGGAKDYEADAPSLALITGPNMAGKSTYIRTAALVTLLAHTGGFVPAERAVVGLCDRIFTRVGAHDELHAGRSTFMVEMTETANICHHATPGSLVILDEIGRGTSTLDGLSLAWAIAEHLAGVGCRCLFATHYHELTSLAPGSDRTADRDDGTSKTLANITNLNVTAREWNDQIVFLHRVAAGAADRSYGIQVARLAGLPDPVVKRAQELLGRLAVDHGAGPTKSPAAAPPDAAPLFAAAAPPHPAVEGLRSLDLDRLTPMDAFDALRRLRGLADDDG